MNQRTPGQAVVHTAVLLGTGYLIGRMLRELSVRGRWLVAGIVVCAIGWFVSLDVQGFQGGTYDANSMYIAAEQQSDWAKWTLQSWAFALAGVLMLIALVQDTRAHWLRLRAEQYAAQQSYEAQYVPQAPVQAPIVQQRTERTVKVVRTPQSNVATYTAADVRPAIAERSQPRPVRHREQVGNLIINDRRAFDPELGE